MRAYTSSRTAERTPILLTEDSIQRCSAVDAKRLSNIQSWLISSWSIVVVALVVRVLLVFIRHTYRYPLTMTAEEGCIAQALAAGRGFSSVFCRGDAPTAWEGPIYPALVSILFRLFGQSTALKAAIVLTNALLSALVAPAILKLSRYILDSRAGMYAAWGWALFPVLVVGFGQNWGTATVWDTNLSALLLSMAILFSYIAINEGAIAHAAAGACWGVVGLTNVSCLSILPFCVLALRSKISTTIRLRSIIAAGLAFIIPVGAWIARNSIVFRQPVFLRSNLGVELWIGNSPSAMGWTSVHPHPFSNEKDMDDYLRLGELRYAHEAMRQALHFMHQHPGAVLFLTSKRVFTYWAGIVDGRHFELRNLFFIFTSLLAMCGSLILMRRRHPGWILFFGCTFVYPLIYYVTETFPRYRQVVEPELALLITVAISAGFSGLMQWLRSSPARSH